MGGEGAGHQDAIAAVLVQRALLDWRAVGLAAGAPSEVLKACLTLELLGDPFEPVSLFVGPQLEELEAGLLAEVALVAEQRGNRWGMTRRWPFQVERYRRFSVAGCLQLRGWRQAGAESHSSGAYSTGHH
jgi:hypothetical protein